MIKRKWSPYIRGMIAVGLVASLTLVGMAYATWTAHLHTTGKVTTGSLSVSFTKWSERYTVDLVNAAGFPAGTGMALDYRLEVTDDGRSAELVFLEALPLELLTAGYYLRITYPIAPDQGTVAQLRQYEADFSSPQGAVIFTPQQQLVVLDGTGYLMEAITESYAVSLRFDMYQAVRAQGGGGFEGVVFLSLSQSSIETVLSLPDIIGITASEFSEAVPATVRDSHMDGVLVTYRATVPIGVDQAETAGTKGGSAT